MNDTIRSPRVAPRTDPPNTPTYLPSKGVATIAVELRALLADVFALYVKTKNFHLQMSDAQFRGYHLLMDERSDQVFAMTDDIAERARKVGEATVRSICDIARFLKIGAGDGPIKSFMLRGIKDAVPHLHDSRCLTGEDTVEFFNLVLELKLTREEKQDLSAFLR